MIETNKTVRQLHKYFAGKGLIYSPNTFGILLVSMLIVWGGAALITAILYKLTGIMLAPIAMLISGSLGHMFQVYCFWRRDVVIWEERVSFKDALLDSFPIIFRKRGNEKEE